VNIENVIKEYKPTVFGIALSNLRNQSDAEDVFQDVFLIYFKKHLDGKLNLKNDEHRKAWLIRTTLNRCKKYKTSLWKKRWADLEENSDSASDDWRFALEEENAVYSAMSTLPEKYRNVLHLFYFEDLSVEKVSETLKIKQNTIRVQLKRGRELMRNILKQDYFYEGE